MQRFCFVPVVGEVVRLRADPRAAPPGVATRQGYEVPEDIRHEVQDCVQQFLSQAVFPPSEAGDSAITIPLIFD